MSALKEAFLIKVPNVNPKESRTSIVLPHYEFHAILVEDFEMAKSEGLSIIEERGIHAIILCAGFTNEEVGDLSKYFGPNVGVVVARGDERSGSIVSKAIHDANW